MMQLSASTAAIIGTTGGLSFATTLAFFKWLITLATKRMDAREARIDQATRELISQLQQQVAGLIADKKAIDEALADCRDRDVEKERRIAHLEGLLSGIGGARQHAALIVAAEKVSAKANGEIEP